MLRRALFGGLVVSLMATPSLACEEYYEVDNTQAKELVAQLQNPEADEIDQVIAFDTLICAKRVALRGIALRHGRKASSPDVRAQVLHRALFGMERVVIKFLRAEGLSTEQANFAQKNPTAFFEVTAKIPKKNCISFYRERCAEDAIQIIGNKMHLNYGDQNAELELQPDGRLIGLFWNTDWKEMEPMPIEIELQ